MLGSKLLIKMWETTAEKGIGVLFKPWAIRREGLANLEMKRKELLVLAQTEVDVAKIRSGEAYLSDGDIYSTKILTSNGLTEVGSKVEPVIDLNVLVKNSNLLNSCDNIQQEINITKSLLNAEKILEKDHSEVPNGNVEDDWLFRWRDYARETNSEKLQSLWGSVLAGEIKQPGSFSLRTLEFIKNLSQNEAKEIEVLFNYVFWNYRVLSSKNHDDHDYLNFSFLLKMQNLGVISGADSDLISTLKLLLKNEDKYYFYISYNERFLYICGDEKGSEVRFQVCLLTDLGKELYKLCSPVNDSKYFDKIVHIIKESNHEVYECRVINSNGADILDEFKKL